MTGPDPFRNILRLIKPPGAARTDLIVLAAYFDDSGTHHAAKIVVWAGWIAPTSNWEAFDADWVALLEKWGLPAFHMAHCEACEGAFAFWRRADCDRAIYEFREAILKHKLFGIAAGMDKADWEAAKPSMKSKGIITAEQFCIAACMREAVLISRKYMPQDQLAIALDKKQLDADIMRGIAHFYEQFAAGDPELVAVTYQEMKAFPALQAADMLAWEYYSYCCEYVASGKTARPRPHFQHLAKKELLQVEFWDKAAIEDRFKFIKWAIDSSKRMPSRKLPS